MGKRIHNSRGLIRYADQSSDQQGPIKGTASKISRVRSARSPITRNVGRKSSGITPAARRGILGR